ncbi:hypothetical protein T09_6681 [Trichinella sp. T9]|nr:hypothetical protein T09_6681 [Trichinella sp. T9]
MFKFKMLKINKLGKSVKLKRVLSRELSFCKQNVSLCDHPVVYLAICSLVFSSSSWVSAGVGNGKSEFLKSKPSPVSSGIKYDYDVEAAVGSPISNAESTDDDQWAEINMLKFGVELALWENGLGQADEGKGKAAVFAADCS